MKIENLLFSLIVVFVAVVILSIVGWGFSFLIAGEITSKDGAELTDVKLFLARVVIGLFIIGVSTGACKLWSLFTLCISYDKDKI